MTDEPEVPEASTPAEDSHVRMRQQREQAESVDAARRPHGYGRYDNDGADMDGIRPDDEGGIGERTHDARSVLIGGERTRTGRTRKDMNDEIPLMDRISGGWGNISR